MSVDDQRARVVDIAKTWLRTPFHMGAQVRGVGVDCGTLLTAVYGAAGFDVPQELGFFAAQWHKHTKEERYFNIIRQFTREVHEALPGDVAMFRFTKKITTPIAHAAIVVAWPQIIHVHWNTGVEYCDVEHSQLAGRLACFLSPFTRPERPMICGREPAFGL